MGHIYSREFYHIDGKALVYPANTPRKLYTIGFPPYGRLIKLFVQESAIADPGAAAMQGFKVRLYDRDWAINTPVSISLTSGVAMPINVGTVFNIPTNSGIPTVVGQTFYSDLYWTMGGLAYNQAYPSYGSGQMFYGSGWGVQGSGVAFGQGGQLQVPGNYPYYGQLPQIMGTNSSTMRSGALFGDEMYGISPRITSQYQGQMGAMLNIKFTSLGNNACQITTLGTLAMSGDQVPAGWATGLPLPTTTNQPIPADYRYSPPGQITVPASTTTYSVYNPGTLYLSYLPGNVAAAATRFSRAYVILDENLTAATADYINTLGSGTGYTPAIFHMPYGIPYMNREGSFSCPKRQLYLEIDCTDSTPPTSDARLDVEILCEPSGFAS